MFTGIVETVGIVASLERNDASASGGGGTSMVIGECADVLVDAKLGDSISVNGTCLTVTELLGPASFKVGIAPETLRRTNLGSLEQGSRLNLERAVSASTRMGGHFVQGHVDTVAEIVHVHPDGNAKSFRLRPRDSSVLRYVVEKGYVTLDGASLTVTEVEDGPDGYLGVMLIAYTQERVVTAAKQPGDLVNVEVDMVGKYVEKSVQGYFEDKAGAEGQIPILEKMVNRIIDQKLQSRLQSD